MKTYLQEIDLGHNDLSSVHPDVLAQGVNMIQVVKLYDTSLTRYGCCNNDKISIPATDFFFRQQIEKIIKHRGVCKLKTLDICFNAAIREVPRSVLHLAEQKILEFSYLMH